MFKSENLKQILESSGVSYRENGTSYIFSCPRCHKKKLYIQKNEGFFCCFRCKEVDGYKGRCELALHEIGIGGSIFELKEKLYSAASGFHSFSKFIDLKLNNEYFDYEESSDFIEEELPIMEYSPKFQELNDHYNDNSEYYKYLIKRGLNSKIIEKYGILCSPSERSIVFPVVQHERLIGWQLRNIEKSFKITSEGLNKTKTFMFFDNLLQSEHCVLAEGPVSALHAELCGGNVASMGKGVSEYQLNLIRKYSKTLYLALDPDASTVIDRICREFYGEMPVKLLLPTPGYEDLGEMPLELVYEEFLKAPDAFGKKVFYFKSMNDLNF